MPLSDGHQKENKRPSESGKEQLWVAQVRVSYLSRGKSRKAVLYSAVWLFLGQPVLQQRGKGQLWTHAPASLSDLVTDIVMVG